jgi:hypothetical protein
MKDPTLWLLIGLAVGMFLAWLHRGDRESRELMQEIELRERLQRAAILLAVAVALHALMRNRPELFRRRPQEPKDKWPPS